MAGICPEVIRAEDCGLKCERLIEERRGDGSGLVDLHLKGVLPGR